MFLDKTDLKEIKKIVDSSAETTKKELRAEIKASAETTKKEIRQEIRQEIGGVKKIIFDVEEKLSSKIEASKNEVVTTISREVTDLAEINREVINRVDIIGELDKRVTRLEAKVGLKPF